MHEAYITPSQLQDGAAEFGFVAMREAGPALYEPDQATIPNPGYDVAARIFNVDSGHSTFTINPRDERLRQLPGLRVLAGVQTRDLRSIYLPGIVLPDGSHQATIGCLHGPDAIRPEDISRAASQPLSDIQQVYLEQMAAMQGRGVGEHASNAVNVADIGHAALLASTGINAAAAIEGRVHEYVQRGLATQVADSKALDVRVGHTIRQIREVIVPAAKASHIMVARTHQMPSIIGRGLGAANLATGLTLAAVRSQKDAYPQPNLAANVQAMIGGR